MGSFLRYVINVPSRYEITYFGFYIRHMWHEYFWTGAPFECYPLIKISLEPVSMLRLYCIPAMVNGRVKK